MPITFIIRVINTIFVILHVRKPLPLKKNIAQRCRGMCIFSYALMLDIVKINSSSYFYNHVCILFTMLWYIKLFQTGIAINDQSLSVCRIVPCIAFGPLRWSQSFFVCDTCLFCLLCNECAHQSHIFFLEKIALLVSKNTIHSHLAYHIQQISSNCWHCCSTAKQIIIFQ